VLTAGAVWWALRGGALLTSVLASMPVWRHADLLAVLPDEDEEEAWDTADDSQLDLEDDAVSQMLDSTFSENAT
jgi:hypothetical protein